MDYEFEENTCQICLESYEPTKKIPKKLECCSQIFCLQCLNDIYNKHKDHIQCPICRIVTKKSPRDLKAAKEFLEVKSSVTCPSCFKLIKNTEFKFNIIDMCPVMLCNYCCESQDVDKLNTYLFNLVEEMTYFKDFVVLILAK
jgi:hypothetical protein